MGAAAEPASESFGLKPEVKAPNISTMIESAFKSGGTGGWGAAADSAGSVPHEQLMEQYVKEKMGGEEGKQEDKGGEGGAAGGAGNMVSEEDRLYTIPEDFKKKVGWGVFFSFLLFVGLGFFFFLGGGRGCMSDVPIHGSEGSGRKNRVGGS